MSSQFGCENSRVQLPGVLHIVKLGYTYIPRITLEKAGSFFDPKTNILTEIFKKQFLRLNPGANEDKANQVLHDITVELDNDDLGEKFYRRLVNVSGEKLIDFENYKNNTFHVTAEFSCYDVKENGAENQYTELFRPDITLFINGLPLTYIEVKIPILMNGQVSVK